MGPWIKCIDSVHYIGTFVGIPAAKALTRTENREVLMPSNYRKSKQFNWSDIVSNAFMPLRSSSDASSSSTNELDKSTQCEPATRYPLF